MANPIIHELKKCSCCGETHKEVEAKPFTREPYLDTKHRKYHFTHWAICPTLLEPIIMRLQDNEGDNDPYVLIQTRES